MDATSPSGDSETPSDRLGDAYGDEVDDASEDFADEAENSQNSDDVRYDELAGRVEVLAPFANGERQGGRGPNSHTPRPWTTALRRRRDSAMLRSPQPSNRATRRRK